MEKELTERDRALIDCLKISAARGRQIREQTEAEMRLAAAYRIILEAAGNDDSKDKPKEEV